MRTVKKTWLTNSMDHQEKIPYEEALKELELIFDKYPQEIIKEKLDQGTRLGSGTGTFYQILVTKNKKKKGEKIMEKKSSNPPGKRTVWIDEKLHKKLKVLASKEGKKMGIFVENLINQSLKGDK